MKCAFVIANDLKQVMLTPETEQEKTALRLIGESGQDITVDYKWGSFYSTLPPSAHGYTVQESQGGYLRAYECADALMLVIRPKPKDTDINVKTEPSP